VLPDGSVAVVEACIKADLTKGVIAVPGGLARTSRSPVKPAF